MALFLPVECMAHRTGSHSQVQVIQHRVPMSGGFGITLVEPPWRRHAPLPRTRVHSAPLHRGYVMSAWVASAMPIWLVAVLATALGVAVPVTVAAIISRQAARRQVASSIKRRDRGGVEMIWKVAKRLLWSKPHRKRVMTFLLILFFALVLSNVTAVAQSYAQRDYMTALAQRDAALFSRGLSYALFLLALGMPSRCLVDFATGGLGIAWRNAITDSLVADYFQPQASYWLRREGRVPDPDMRIATEAGHFADAAVLMVRDFFENGMKLMGFIGVVYTISAKLCSAMVLYAGLGALATVYLFGRPLIRLDKGIRAQEASFRAAISRCYGKAEALSFSRGEAAEAESASERYRVLRQQQWSRVWWRTGLSSFRDCFNWAAYLVPIALVGPLWLRGEVAFGVLSQVVMAFQVSLSALSVVIRKFRSVSSLVAEGSRLEGLAEALRHTGGTSVALPVQVDGRGVEVENLSLSLPSGVPLCTSLSFSVQPGQRLLIFGESGTGKTTLIRALAGLWADGTGTVRCTASSVFLSQDPYIPEGSLRRVLTFPACDDALFSDAEVLTAARSAQLGSVLERYTLDAVVDWEAVLSRGEQQRCAFCRVLLARPELAVLDEATSALDAENEAALYGALEAPCVISISHRPTLRAFHTHLLRRDGNGCWQMELVE
mmetsp:Transcript_89785/g.262458  ORF Transcript_89785/g.262458 Transcript_89785/m.262458 type:complete len:663 (-) Transcript_89785:116-2104(-)